MSEVALLPGTDTRNCKSNTIQSLRPTDHSFQLLPHQNKQPCFDPRYAPQPEQLGHSTPAVEFTAEFTDMQYEIVAKYDVDHVLHYVLDYVLSTLFSTKYEIFRVRRNIKDLTAKFQHLLWASSPE